MKIKRSSLGKNSLSKMLLKADDHDALTLDVESGSNMGNTGWLQDSWQGISCSAAFSWLKQGLSGVFNTCSCCRTGLSWLIIVPMSTTDADSDTCTCRNKKNSWNIKHWKFGEVSEEVLQDGSSDKVRLMWLDSDLPGWVPTQFDHEQQREDQPLWFHHQVELN